MPKKLPVTVGGVTYDSLKDAADAHGIPYMTAYRRVKSLGWSLERAMSCEVRGTGKSMEVVIDGKVFPSMSKAAEHYGVPQTTISERLRRGATLSEAVNSDSFRIAGARDKLLMESKLAIIEKEDGTLVLSYVGNDVEGAPRSREGVVVNNHNKENIVKLLTSATTNMHRLTDYVLERSSGGE